MSPADEAFLRNEFEAGEGSFLIGLRGHLRWDEERFAELVGAMTTVCESLSDDDEVALERWVASGFWALHSFTGSWVMHPAFPRPRPEDYYRRAFELLEWLADWLFTGTPSFVSSLRAQPEYREFYGRPSERPHAGPAGPALRSGGSTEVQVIDDAEDRSARDETDSKTRQDKEKWDADNDNSRDSSSRNNDATRDRDGGGRERGRD